MTPEPVQRAYELFERAVHLPPDQRDALLAEQCGKDHALRSEIESLLEHDQQVGKSFMQPPASSADANLAEDNAETKEHQERSGPKPTGPQIEGYKIVRELSRGGQGVVYQALQRSTKRKVAIKILLEGQYALKSAQRRFEREIELIAQLKHPNIITIFHSGRTVDGLHFYVMDYVRGAPLNQYVRDQKLTLEETLQLFTVVCAAIRYAHQKGVIHRDLKPTNILMDAAGVPKVMDFGLAKLLAGPEQSLVSISRELVGTLPYMSPEQARGNPDEIDTRTDIYALGVILYELLTGCYPYPVTGELTEVLKHIAETPPAPPRGMWTSDSGVTRRSSGRLRPGKCPIDNDVQTIVLKALAKDREDRYQSVEELRGDIHHFLKGELISARPPSLAYQLSFFARRNKRLVAGVVAAFVVSIVVGAGTTLYFRAQAARATARAALSKADAADARTELARQASERSKRLLKIETERKDVIINSQGAEIESLLAENDKLGAERDNALALYRSAVGKPELDLSSPRAAVRTFITAVQAAEHDYPGRIDDAVECLDTSELTGAARAERARELARRLHRIIEKRDAKLNDIPDEAEGTHYLFFQLEHRKGITPTPEIRLSRDRESGNWRFTPRTLASITALEDDWERRGAVVLSAKWTKVGKPGIEEQPPDRPGESDQLNLHFRATDVGWLYIFLIHPDSEVTFEPAAFGQSSCIPKGCRPTHGPEFFGTFRLNQPPGDYTFVAVLTTKEERPEFCDEFKAELKDHLTLGDANHAVEAAIVAREWDRSVLGYATFNYSVFER